MGERKMIDPETRLALHDKVILKKPHPCGENRWEIIRLGADVKLKCLGCGHVIMLDRLDFLASLRRVLDECD